LNIEKVRNASVLKKAFLKDLERFPPDIKAKAAKSTYRVSCHSQTPRVTKRQEISQIQGLLPPWH
jgi:hypothetical protein